MQEFDIMDREEFCWVHSQADCQFATGNQLQADRHTRDLKLINPF
jgi:hypothetical protein